MCRQQRSLLYGAAGAGGLLIPFLYRTLTQVATHQRNRKLPYCYEYTVGFLRTGTAHITVNPYTPDEASPKSAPLLLRARVRWRLIPVRTWSTKRQHAFILRLATVLPPST